MIWLTAEVLASFPRIFKKRVIGPFVNRNKAIVANFRVRIENRKTNCSIWLAIISRTRVCWEICVVKCTIYACVHYSLEFGPWQRYKSLPNCHQYLLTIYNGYSESWCHVTSQKFFCYTSRHFLKNKPCFSLKICHISTVKSWEILPFLQPDWFSFCN